MKTKSYMVVWLPKMDDSYQITGDGLDDQQIFNDYDEAFDVFNQCLTSEKGDSIRQPKGEQPIRAELPYFDLELWVINRTTDLIK